MRETLKSHQATKEDADHASLKRLIEVRIKRYLWIPADTIRFVPPLASTIYGDGRALFTLSTINNRPAYWVLRVDSGWTSGLDMDAPNHAPEFVEFTDEILTDLEEEFGDARCSWNGSPLYTPKRQRHCKCEDCREQPIAKWPMVDGSGGCSWGRMDWPAGFATIPHPFNCGFNLLKTR